MFCIVKIHGHDRRMERLRSRRDRQKRRRDSTAQEERAEDWKVGR